MQNDVGRDDFDEVVELFLEEVDAHLARFNTTADQGQLAEDLHFLKGSALNLGFVQLSDLCQAGEHALKTGNKDRVDVDEIKVAYEEAKKTLLIELPRLKAA